MEPTQEMGRSRIESDRHYQLPSLWNECSSRSLTHSWVFATLVAFAVMSLLGACRQATAQPASKSPHARAASTATPVPLQQVSPARIESAMAYDANTRQVILFGGLTAHDGSLNDTWAWNGHDWQQLHPSHAPAARTGAVMAYDEANGVLVLYGGGGDEANMFTDTWTWNGKDWTLQHPQVSPTPREGPAMAYDAATQEIVLFGGLVKDNGRATPPVNDTWTWDGRTWTEQHPAVAPPPLFEASMAYDAARQRVLLFGGNGPAVPTNETWSWDGTTWTQLHPQIAPSARVEASMAYDAAMRQVVLIGGGTGLAPFTANDTWLWDGSSWTERTSAHQPGGLYTLAAYDIAMGDVVLYTTPWGKTATPHSQTWLWNGEGWTMLT
jgi:hypothetical protein